MRQKSNKLVSLMTVKTVPMTVTDIARMPEVRLHLVRKQFRFARFIAFSSPESARGNCH